MELSKASSISKASGIDANTLKTAAEKKQQGNYGYQQPERELTEKDVENVVNAFNEMSSITQTYMNYTKHEETGRYFVQVVENGTDKVIREIPPKELLDLAAEMQDFIGMLFDKKI